MAAVPGPAAQRLVLDTNVVLDLLHFRDPGVAAVAAALREGRAVAVTSDECLEELRRVLACPGFALDAAAQGALLDQYAALCTGCDAPAGALPPEFTRCTDCDDQKFLELAWRSGAHCLVTKDKALLRLARRAARLECFAIVAPAGYDTAQNR